MFLFLRLIPLYTDLARAEISTELPLQSNLREPPRRSSKQSLPKTTVVRANAIGISELSLFSKLGIITALELGRGVGSNPKRYQETKRDLHVKLPPDSLHTGMETSTVDDELLAKP
ncbi:hypothetical protein Acr_16g0005090 [Actinidia rufa]|uniref:Uncharacterized protein n=1 Tax=Actinidia rufa TaxID=165716 RepID=A0A7J0FYV7_9ERIC|nr:hypothetical protein Acr_16g0005090 [Actinidia rufa]